MKTVAIFGATSAIAVAYARLEAVEGAKLFLVARNKDKLSTIIDDLKARGASEVNYLIADLGDVSKHEGIVKEVESTLNQIDIAFVAYGSLGEQLSAQHSFEETDAILRVNFFSVVSLLTVVADRFETLRKGKIAVISSVAGDRGRQSNYIYGASKGALNIFLEGLRNRLYPADVQVLTIKPGFVDTPMTAHIKKGPLFASPSQVANDIKRALEWNLNTLYTPWFWMPIMIIIRSIPEFIFKRLKL
jgi:decaprenylphospho-beta-D-erythro-pentofuranosid-2-ulose 2-reductase